MMATKERYMGESPLLGTPKKNLGLVLKDGTVSYNKLTKDVQHRIDRYEDLQNQIDSLEISGMALSQMFGDDPHIGISQKALTDAFNKIWDKISDITGEVYQGITMVVTPQYFTGEDGCKVKITATPGGYRGMFEEITFYVDGEEICHKENVEFFTYEFDIEETVEVICKAKILGVEYTRAKTIHHYDAFWVGAGDSFDDVMNIGHIVPLNEEMKANVNVICNDGDRIYIVMGVEMEEAFVRADMNGVEIPFTKSHVVVDTTEYVVYTSQNTYRAGTYNIDINS